MCGDIKTSVNFGRASEFGRFEDGMIFFTPKKNSSGLYPIKVTLSSASKSTKLYVFTLMVFEIPVEEEVVNITIYNSTHLYVPPPAPKIRIEKLTAYI